MFPMMTVSTFDAYPPRELFLSRSAATVVYRRPLTEALRSQPSATAACSRLATVRRRPVAIFSLTQGGVLVSEAAVPAAPLVQSVRIYAEVAGTVNTGVAIANPNSQAAVINFYFTNSAGTDVNAGTMTIPANSQTAAFLNESPFFTAGSFQGNLADMRTITIQSSVPVSIVALRGLTNERSEFLTTLPVTPLNATVGSPLIFPHFADVEDGRRKSFW